MSSTEGRIRGRGVERQLSAQDKLRLGVLATRNVRAIRIDEAAASLSALTDAGEARIPLDPGPDPIRYFRALREHLSELFLNLPGGYPAHIGRWTRMDSLHRNPARLLLLGDPEAVVAVAFADTIDARVAADVWWCGQSVEIALALLRHPGAADWPVGQELASFILGHLPFEEDAATVAGALGRILQPGLVSGDRVADLWRRGRRRHSWRAGFFLGHPALYPDTRGEHPECRALGKRLSGHGLDRNPVALLLLEFLGEPGRNTLATLAGALDNPREQEVVTLVFRRIQEVFRWPGPATERPRESAAAWSLAGDLLAREGGHAKAIRPLLEEGQWDGLRSLAFLCLVGEEMLAPVFGGNTFSGSVMLRHLGPVLADVRTAAGAVLDFPVS